MKKIFDDKPEIKKQVYEKYPVTKEEKKCRPEKQKRDFLREQFAKQLYDKPEQ